jgi:hypothetical protein
VAAHQEIEMNWGWDPSNTPPWMRQPVAATAASTATAPGEQQLLTRRLHRFADTLGADDLARIAAEDEAMRRLDLALRMLKR